VPTRPLPPRLSARVLPTAHAPHRTRASPHTRLTAHAHRTHSVRFICESVSVEGQYHAIVRWKARATNDGPFLGHTPLGTLTTTLCPPPRSQ